MLGRYRIERVLGTGAYGTVYAAHHAGLDDVIAVKALGTFGDPEGLRKAVAAEFKAQRGLSDKSHILESHIPEVLEEHGLRWILLPMELGTGTFRDWLRQKAGKPEHLAEGLVFLRHAAAGLEVLHAADIVHRDVKPENLILVPDPNAKQTNGSVVKIGDFGLASGIEKLAAERPDLLQDGIGTPAYMAPEQVRAAHWKDVTSAADAYALGTMLFELLDGDLPFSGSDVELRAKKRDKELTHRTPKGPPHLAAMASALMNRDPLQRPSLKGIGSRLVVVQPEDQAAWNNAQAQATEDGYAEYLRQCPEGAYRDDAIRERARLASERKKEEQRQQELREREQGEAADRVRMETERKRRDEEERARQQRTEQARREEQTRAQTEREQYEAAEKAKREATEKAEREGKERYQREEAEHKAREQREREQNEAVERARREAEQHEREERARNEAGKRAQFEAAAREAAAEQQRREQEEGLVEQLRFFQCLDGHAKATSARIYGADFSHLGGHRIYALVEYRRPSVKARTFRALWIDPTGCIMSRFSHATTAGDTGFWITASAQRAGMWSVYVESSDRGPTTGMFNISSEYATAVGVPSSLVPGMWWMPASTIVSSVGVEVENCVFSGVRSKKEFGQVDLLSVEEKNRILNAKDCRWIYAILRLSASKSCSATLTTRWTVNGRSLEPDTEQVTFTKGRRTAHAYGRGKDAGLLNQEPPAFQAGDSLVFEAALDGIQIAKDRVGFL